VDVFNRNGTILLEKLSRHVNGPEFDVTPYMNLCALDNISETSMGVTLNAQQHSDSEYVKAIHRMGWIFFTRMGSPWLNSDTLYNLSPLGRQQQKDLAVLHGLTWSIIRRRKQELLVRSEHQTGEENNEVLGEEI
jgi:hypothetical protein